jgi:NAD-dependent deacetylase
MRSGGVIDGPIERRLSALRARIARSRYTFFMTGSGVSAESGVPTFRGAGGYWREHDVTELATPDAFAANPRLVWDWYLERRRAVLACSPNAGHRAIAAWLNARTGMLITQNVDGLHERAGTPGVVRFHGSLWTNRCSACGEERVSEDVHYDALPTSPCCGAAERPGVVWFGEAIPRRGFDAAEEAMAQADVMLVVGTSGVVFPAAGIAQEARYRGVPVITVNPEIIGGDSEDALPLPAGEALPRLLALE